MKTILVYVHRGSGEVKCTGRGVQALYLFYNKQNIRGKCYENEFYQEYFFYCCNRTVFC